jgi:hypothetical protein
MRSPTIIPNVRAALCSALHPFEGLVDPAPFFVFNKKFFFFSFLKIKTKRINPKWYYLIVHFEHLS